MFNFFKKSLSLVAPMTGKVINLSDVPDEVFSQKMLGDGVAIQPTGDVVVAPCDGTLSVIMDTKHAFAMTSDKGLEILVHVGLDTVNLKGEGFTVLCEVGKKIKAGTPILKVDKKFIEDKGINLVTPLLVTNGDIVKSMDLSTGDVAEAGKSSVITYSL